MALVRRFVHVMGGEIEVESVPGKGSTFRFRVPVRQQEAPVLVVDSSEQQPTALVAEPEGPAERAAPPSSLERVRR